GHVHKVAGASNFGPSATYGSLRQSNCTSCEIQDDKSAYWTPQLYYKHVNGTFEEVPNQSMAVYYLGRGQNRDQIIPLPPGFRMLSGNSLQRSFDSTTKTYKDSRFLAERVSFACLDAAPSREQPYMWNMQCSNGLRAQVHFQTCWDGVNLYKDDQSHVAYMSGIDNGVCPPTHPKLLPHIFFKVLYGVNEISKDAGGQFVFANGDATGYSFHGDFMNGWDPAVLQATVKDCLNTDNAGDIDTCPSVAKSHKKNTRQICPERPRLVAEVVK
ncbi:hypothetical protein LTS18_013004, partial [Coniosporium uncinatum]